MARIRKQGKKPHGFLAGLESWERPIKESDTDARTTPEVRRRGGVTGSTESGFRDGLENWEDPFSKSS